MTSGWFEKWGCCPTLFPWQWQCECGPMRVDTFDVNVFDGWTDGWTDGWRDGGTDGGTDGIDGDKSNFGNCIGGKSFVVDGGECVGFIVGTIDDETLTAFD